MNKILIALVLAVVMSGSVFADAQSKCLKAVEKGKEVDGDNSQSVINDISQNMLSRDSIFLREQIKKNSPDIELSQEIEIGGDAVKVNIPMTVTFFWPES